MGALRPAWASLQSPLRNSNHGKDHLQSRSIATTKATPLEAELIATKHHHDNSIGGGEPSSKSLSLNEAALAGL